MQSVASQTADPGVVSLIPAPIHAWRLIKKYFLRPFFYFRLFKKGFCPLQAKVCVQSTG